MEEYIEFDKYRLKLIHESDERQKGYDLIHEKFVSFLKGKNKKQLMHILEYGVPYMIMENILEDEELIDDLEYL